ncbi:MAG: hypothetical protein ABIQ16_27025 [Polyangiaceae bacterium]
MQYRDFIVWAGVVVLTAGCSAAQPGTGSPARSSTGGASSGGADTALDPNQNLTAGSTGNIDTNNGGMPGMNPNEPTCASTSATPMITKEPVDIILVLDNSGSMADELDAVEKNINVNFATILQQSGVDYRVILISRHRKDVRAASGESSTSICVSAPLSGLPTCPGPKPVNSERFFQYSIKIESSDSFDQILATYNLRDAKFDLTKLGWSEWLRPGAKKVFLEMTDDNAALPVDTFVQKLVALSPQFGTDATHPTFTFHSIIGIKEKALPAMPYLADEPVQMAECNGGGDKVANAGLSYQDLSKRTGGLRFPICEFASYDTVFKTIADDVVVKSQLACDFDIPMPPDGQELDLTKVAVAYTKSGVGDPIQFGQASSSAACEANAFYIQNDHIYLCPDTCQTIKADSSAKVDVLFTCQSTIIIPK